MSQSTETQVRAAFVGLDELQSTVTFEDILHAAGPVRPVAETLPQRPDRTWSLRPVWVGLAAAAVVAVLIVAPLLWRGSTDAPPATTPEASTTTIDAAPTTVSTPAPPGGDAATQPSPIGNFVPLDPPYPSSRFVELDGGFLQETVGLAGWPAGQVDGLWYANMDMPKPASALLHQSVDGFTFEPTTVSVPFEEQTNHGVVAANLFWMQRAEACNERGTQCVRTVYRSEEAVEWSEVAIPDNGFLLLSPVGDTTLRNGDTIVAVGAIEVTSDRSDYFIATSVDAGRSFSFTSLASNYRGVAIGQNADEYFAVVNRLGPGGTLSVVRSTDGLVWSEPIPINVNLPGEEAPNTIHSITSVRGDRELIAIRDEYGVRVLRYSTNADGTATLTEEMMLQRNLLGDYLNSGVWTLQSPYAAPEGIVIPISNTQTEPASIIAASTDGQTWGVLVNEGVGGTWNLERHVYIPPTDATSQWRVAAVEDFLAELQANA